MARDGLLREVAVARLKSRASPAHPAVARRAASMPRIASTVLILSLGCFMVMGHLLEDAGPRLAPLAS
eukprot:5781638-Pyramimonas_sp.AAC.1